NKKVAVAATQMTTRLHAYQKEINFRAPQISVTELAAPELVPLIEANAGHDAYLRVLKKTLAPLQGKDFDTLVLGCTHYPIIWREFTECVKPGVQIVDPADQVAQYTYNVMRRDCLFSDNKGAGQHEYYTTGDVKVVDELG
ncbi:glutamate racemase, partial [Lactobacillus sp. XV13L]|nr:glutamate racemase [Lactobacillus sp. XV13L]